MIGIAIDALAGPLGSALAVAVAAAILWWNNRQKARLRRENEALRGRLRTRQEVEDREHEAETQDDTSLADRISRGR